MSGSGTIMRPRSLSPARDWLRWFDASWTAVAASTILFSYTLGSKAVLLILALMPIYIWARWARFARVLASISPILLLPGFAILSSLWSVAPGVSAYYGFQYLVTVLIGATIGAGTDRRQALIGLFLAFGNLALCNMLFGREVGWGGGGARVTTAFAGLFGSKNAAADTAAVGVLIAGAMLAAMLRERRAVAGFIALGVLTVDLWILRRAESTGALVACLVAVLVLLGWNLARVMSAQARSAVFLASVAAALVAAASQGVWRKPLTAALLHATGKDPTLTGRTYIWDRAFALIQARPALGLGYSAFWQHGNIEAEGLWLFAGIGERTGFNFHNTFIEILVHLGIVGLCLYALVALSHFLLLAVRTMRAPDDLGILFCAYLSYVAVRLSIETQAFGPFSNSTMMVMAGLGCAVWSAGRKPSAIPMPPSTEPRISWRSAPRM